MTTILCFLTTKYQLSNTLSQRNWENAHRCRALVTERHFCHNSEYVHEIVCNPLRGHTPMTTTTATVGLSIDIKIWEIFSPFLVKRLLRRRGWDDWPKSVAYRHFLLCYTKVQNASLVSILIYNMIFIRPFYHTFIFGVSCIQMYLYFIIELFWRQDTSAVRRNKRGVDFLQVGIFLDVYFTKAKKLCLTRIHRIVLISFKIAAHNGVTEAVTAF